jgi:hypothetical protein
MILKNKLFFNTMNLTEKQIEHFWNGVEKGEGCWNWKRGLTADGYGTSTVGNKKTMKASRIALLLTTPNPDNKPYALHKCKSNRKCCNPEHLYWGDQTDNMRDRVKDGTHYQKGECQPFSKLTELQVKEIRQKYSTGDHSYQTLGDEYKVHKSCISKIVKRESWTHI